jgi:hypothetical protein
LFDSAVSLVDGFINHRSSRSISRQRASLTAELKLTIFASDIDQCIEESVKTTIFDSMKWSVDESQQRGDFRLSPLLDRQARPPVN